MLALTREDVQELVPMPLAIELMKQVFADLSAGNAVSPIRTPLDVPPASGVSLFMPAYVPSAEGLGMKIVSVFPNNSAKGLPTIHAIVVLVSTETGQPVAILDGTFLTALRTGAVSGAATDLLARADSRVLTCIGAGAQGVTQAWATASVRPIERIYVHDVNPQSVESFGDRLAAYDEDMASKVVPATDLNSALSESDIICTATTSRHPVFDDQALKPGAHINAVGAFTPEMQEIPAETVVRALVVVDAVDAALAEAGDLVIPIEQGLISKDHISTELGQIVAGSATGRATDDQITLFKTVGNAVQDVIVARQALREAEQRGKGQNVSL